MTTVEALKQLFVGSGAGWVLWLLGALSVASLTMTLERWFIYRTRSADLTALARALDLRLEAGEIELALAELGRSRSVAASVAAAGLRMARLGAAAVSEAIRGATMVEKRSLERRLAYLGTLGNNAPFIGLFGTVIGIIQVFEELGHGAPGHGAGTGAVAGGSQVASQAVMSGIAEALVATAVGIAVALPAVAAYNYLQRRMASLLADADILGSVVMTYLSGSNGPPPGEGGARAPVSSGSVPSDASVGQVLVTEAV